MPASRSPETCRRIQPSMRSIRLEQRPTSSGLLVAISFMRAVLCARSLPKQGMCTQGARFSKTCGLCRCSSTSRATPAQSASPLAPAPDRHASVSACAGHCDGVVGLTAVVVNLTLVPTAPLRCAAPIPRASFGLGLSVGLAREDERRAGHDGGTGADKRHVDILDLTRAGAPRGLQRALDDVPQAVNAARP